MRMGQDGIKYPLKPEENGGEVGTGGGGGGGGGLFGTGLFQNGIFGNRPTRPPSGSTGGSTGGGTTDVPQIDTDVFDPITEIKLKPWIPWPKHIVPSRSASYLFYLLNQI